MLYLLFVKKKVNNKKLIKVQKDVKPKIKHFFNLQVHSINKF